MIKIPSNSIIYSNYWRKFRYSVLSASLFDLLIKYTEICGQLFPNSSMEINRLLIYVPSLKVLRLRYIHSKELQPISRSGITGLRKIIQSLGFLLSQEGSKGRWGKGFAKTKGLTICERTLPPYICLTSSLPLNLAVTETSFFVFRVWNDLSLPNIQHTVMGMMVIH